MPRFQFVGAAVSEVIINAPNRAEARKAWRQLSEERLRARHGRVTVQLLTDEPAIVDENGRLHRQGKPSGVCATRGQQVPKQGDQG